MNQSMRGWLQDALAQFQINCDPATGIFRGTYIPAAPATWIKGEAAALLQFAKDGWDPQLLQGETIETLLSDFFGAYSALYWRAAWAPSSIGDGAELTPWMLAARTNYVASIQPIPVSPKKKKKRHNAQMNTLVFWADPARWSVVP